MNVITRDGTMHAEIRKGAVELVIVGAGLSGVTALTVARNYIAQPKKIIIADARSRYGGHWVDTYDFVRLHQPYFIYTAYNQPWALTEDRSHLATRKEVLHHLEDVGRRAAPYELFGHRYIGHVPLVGNEDLLEVTFVRVNAGKGDKDDDGGTGDGVGEQRQQHCDGAAVHENEVIKIRTKRLIHGAPFLHRGAKALHISSSRATSIDIRQLSFDIKSNNGNKSNTHYILVGGGKSALDAACHIHDNCDVDRTALSIIIGDGVAFLRRGEVYPALWLGRQILATDKLSVTVDAVRRWDGENQREVLRDMVRRGAMISTVNDPASCHYGVLGDEEMWKIQRVVTNLVRGHMCDVVDSCDDDDDDENNSGSVDVLLSKLSADDGDHGDTVRVALQQKNSKPYKTVIVNCTEQTVEPHNTTPRPLVTDANKTLEIQLAFASPGASAAYLVHAWLAGVLTSENGMQRELVRMDLPMGREGRDRVFFTAGVVALWNHSVLIQKMGPEIVGRDLASSIRWFPKWWRRLIAERVQRRMPDVKRVCEKAFGTVRYPVEE